MPSIGGGWYAELLRRLLTVGGAADSSIGREVAPDLSPVLVVETDRPEWGYLRGERLGIGRTTQAAAVGFFSFAGILNPAGSGVLLTVERAIASTTSPNPCLWTVRGRADFVGTPGFNRDTRWGAVNTGTAARIFQGTAGVAPNDGIIMWLADSSVQGPVPVVLPPDSELLVYPVSVQLPIEFSVLWRERAQRPFERP